MVLTKKLIDILLMRYSNIQHTSKEYNAFYSKTNWLIDIDDEQTKIQLACLYEEVAKIMLTNSENYLRLFEYVIFPLAKEFSIKFQRTYDAKSFVSVLFSEYCKIVSNNLVAHKPSDLIVEIMENCTKINERILEDLELKQQLDFICK